MRSSQWLVWLPACLSWMLSAAWAAAADPPPLHSDNTPLPNEPQFRHVLSTNALVVADDQGRMHPVRTTADWQRRRQQILADLQLVMGPLPAQWRNLPMTPEVVEEIRLETCRRRKITLRVEPEDRLTAYLFIPENLAGRAPAILCLHQTTAIGKDEPAGLGGHPNLHYALELAQRGFITLAPDYWTFGDYRQSDYDPYKHGYQSGTMKGIWNHVRCLDYLQSLAEVNTNRLGCIGHSLGGHNALWLAAFDERVKAVVSSCGFNSMRSYAASPYGGGTLKNYAQLRYLPRIASVYDNDPRKVPFEWGEVLAALAPRPVFVNAPLRDENFVVEGVRECLRVAEPVYRWLGAPEGLVVCHPDTGHDFPPEIREAAYRFFDRTLQRAVRPD